MEEMGVEDVNGSSFALAWRERPSFFSLRKRPRLCFRFVVLTVWFLGLEVCQGFSISTRNPALRSDRHNIQRTSNDDSVHLRVVHVNDVYKLDHLPKLQGFVKRLRQEDDQSTTTICTLGGDFLSPCLLSSIDQGEAMVACLSPVVDYAGLGNHEADVGTEALMDHLHQSMTVVNSNFPVFPMKLPQHVTLTLKSEHQRHMRQVTLLGLLDPSPNLYLPNAFCQGAVEQAGPILETAQRYQQELAQDVDMILPLTHQDLDLDVQMAERLGCPRTMPLILGGHDHEPYDIIVIQTPAGPNGGESAKQNADGMTESPKCRVLKAGQDAEQAIVVDLVWDSPTATAPSVDVNFVPIPSLDDSHVDSELQSLVEYHQAPLTRLDRTILKDLEPRNLALSSVGVRKHQTTVGSLIGTALRKALRADVAILNAGSIRGNTKYTSGLPIQNSTTNCNGDDNDDSNGRAFFTFADLLCELPFTTEICVVNLPGHVLEAAIDYSRNPERQQQGGGFLQCCNKLDVVQDGGWRIRSIRGKPLNPAKVYRVACLHHLLTGMDNLQPLVDYLEQHPSNVPPLDSARPAKDLVLQVYHREIWLSLGTFEDLDTDNSDYVTFEELRVALANKFDVEPTNEIVTDTLKAFDANENGEVTRQEYNACIQALQKNRFDLDPSEAMMMTESI